MDLVSNTRVERPGRRGGFSGIELVCFVLITIITVSMVTFAVLIVMPSRRSGHGHAREAAALAQMGSFRMQLTTFSNDNGFLPTGPNGLVALVQQPPRATNWHGPYVEGVPQDPWGQAYVYRCPGRHTSSGYPCDLLSPGPPGENRPICNYSIAALRP
jgi:general secretion pathway protein G